MGKGWKRGKIARTRRTHKTASELGWKRRKMGLTRPAQVGGINLKACGIRRFTENNVDEWSRNELAMYFFYRNAMMPTTVSTEFMRERAKRDMQTAHKVTYQRALDSMSQDNKFLKSKGFTLEQKIEGLLHAERERNEARKRFESAKPGTRKWRDAEEELNFWQGKVAFFENIKPEKSKGRTNPQEVAETIQRQIGKQTFTMIGAKNQAFGQDVDGKTYLQFQVGKNPKGITHIRVTYDEGSDTYEFHAGKFSRKTLDYKKVKEIDNVFVGDLDELIGNTTGLDTRLSSKGLTGDKRIRAIRLAHKQRLSGASSDFINESVQWAFELDEKEARKIMDEELLNYEKYHEKALKLENKRFVGVSRKGIKSPVFLDTKTNAYLYYRKHPEVNQWYVEYDSPSLGKTLHTAESEEEAKDFLDRHIEKRG